MGSCFVPLHSQSDGSWLRGCASPGELARAAARAGHAALALADVESLAHAVTFFRAARAEGVRPILGLELRRPECAALLLARDREGYARLCALATAAAMEPGFDAAAALLGDARGLFVLSDHAATLRRLAPLPEGTAFTRLRAGCGAPALAQRAARLAHEAHRPLVATGETLWLEEPQRELRRALEAARRKTLAARVPPESAAPAHARLLGPEAAEREFEAFPGARIRNAALAEACRVDILPGRPIFPAVDVPSGDPLEHLRARCEEGLHARYGPCRLPAARRRLRHELAQAHGMGFTPYFLLVARIMDFARGAGIPSVGRGSGASSVIAYALGITNVDPLEHRLFFERFLHPERPDCPDLDIDLCWKRREEVIAHVQRAWPGGLTAMIATHATFGFRSAFRETAKALGVGPADTDRLAARLPRSLETTASEVHAALAEHPPARRVDWREPELDAALRLAASLEGRLHHLGMHPGGVVIADRPLTHYTALARSPRGVTITQCEMRAVEALGLVKMDLLGNRALSEIAETVAAVGDGGSARASALGGRGEDGSRLGSVLSAARAPDGDPATVALLQTGRTLSCFQLESPAMRHLLRQMRPASLADTVAAVALIRPGPSDSGMKERYLRRLHGLEPVSVPHPWLREALEPTLGLLLYEEDVMTVAAAMLGQPLADGDLVRRAISATHTDAERAALGHTFIARCVQRGVEEAVAREVWASLARFAAYSFCKAHAAGYGALAWHAAYLKAHHPVEFYRAVANHHQGMYPLWVHLEEARRVGVEVRGPAVNASEEEFTLEDAGLHRAVRAGLATVAALSAASRARLLAARRADGPFASLPDFLARARLPERECAALIEAGAFDFTGRTRAALLFELAATRDAYRDAQPGGLFPGHRAPCALPDLPEFEPLESMTREMKAAGFAVSGPPLLPWAGVLGELRPAPADTLERRVGREVRVAGLPCAARRVRARDGRRMLFLTLAAATGLVECTFFPDAYALAPPPVEGGPLLVEGRVEEQMGAVTVTARRWSRLPDPRPGDAGPRAADVSARTRDARADSGSLPLPRAAARPATPW
ncbi:MAG: DNA polymerase III subunit alpha [Candidatus Eisenbacteria bacterium]|nr:DNA polymerase III subunit alpha [Candidatus Eisenbacteria bacterium]